MLQLAKRSGILFLIVAFSVPSYGGDLFFGFSFFQVLKAQATVGVDEMIASRNAEEFISLIKTDKVDKTFNEDNEVVGVEFQQNVSIIDKGVLAEIANGMKIATIDHTLLPLEEFIVTVLSDDEIAQTEKASDEIEDAQVAAEFGIPGKHLVFTKPVKMTIPMPSFADGKTFAMKVQHEGEGVNTKGITQNPDATCNPDGSSNDENNQVTVENGAVSFYTCGASLFIVDTNQDNTDDAILWLKADGNVYNSGTNQATDGQTIDTWVDGSISANDALEDVAGGASKPIFNANAINFNPAVSLNANDDRLKFINNVHPGGSQNITVYSVVYPSNGGALFVQESNGGVSVNPIFKGTGNILHARSDASGNTQVLGQGNATNISKLDSYTQTNTNILTTYGNGAEKNTDTMSAPPYTTLTGNNYLGARVASVPSNYNGLISEFLIYNEAQDISTRQKINSYLAIKYGITLDQSVPYNYLSSSGVVLWDAVTHSTYNNDIFGIGRDNGFSLNQRISKSVNTDSVITLSTDTNFVDANSTHANVLADGDYLVVGNDDDAAAWTSTGAPAGFRMLERKWQAHQTGAVGATNIQFNVADAEFDIPDLEAGNSYYFVIDSDGDGDLSDEIPTVLTNSSGDLWTKAVDFADGAIFTLVSEFAVPPVEVCNNNGGVGWAINDPSSGNNVTDAVLTFNFGDDVTGAFDVNASLKVTHTYVGDLIASVDSPAGTNVEFFNRPGKPASTYGCSQDNLFVTFDDEASVGANIENICSASNTGTNNPGPPYAISGTYYAQGGTGNELSAFDGEIPNGDWHVNFIDNEAQDLGNFAEACLIIEVGALTMDEWVSTDATCSDKVENLSVDAGNDVYHCYEVINGGTETFTVNNGDVINDRGYDFSLFEGVYPAQTSRTLVQGPFVAGDTEFPIGTTHTSSSVIVHGNTANFTPAQSLSTTESMTLVVTRVVPRTPLMAPDLQDASDTGLSTNDDVTSNATPTVDVECSEVGTTITLYTDNPLAGTVAGTHVCAAPGIEALTINPALPDGEHTLTYTESNIQGESDASPATNITIDTTAPADASVTTAPTPANDGTVITTTVTSVEEGATVAIPGMVCAPSPADNTGQVICTGTVGDNGLDGVDTGITITDLAGNTNTNADSGLLVDNMPPSIPTINAPTTGNPVTGTAEAGSTVTVITPSGATCLAVADAQGDYSCVLVPSPVNGEDVSVTATDDAGNTSAANIVNAGIDLIPPTAPLIVNIDDDTGISNIDSVTNDTTIVINGTAEADSEVEVFVDGISIGTTTADANGDWSIGRILPEGSYDITAIATDDAGNESIESNTLALIIDTTPFDAPMAPLDMLASSDSGATTTDNVTNDTTPTFDAECREVGAVLTLYVSGVAQATHNCTVVGTVQLTPSPALTQGINMPVSYTETDIAGNESPASVELSITIDTTDPFLPTITTPIESDDVVNGAEEADVLIAGTAEAGSTVTVVLSDGISPDVTVSVVTNNNGNWTLLGNEADIGSLNQGTINVSVTATDTAGNTSDIASTTVQHDSVAPSVAMSSPDLQASSDSGPVDDDNVTNVNQPTFDINCIEGSMVSLYADVPTANTLVGSALCNALGVVNITPVTPLDDGEYNFTSTETDPAGNESIQSPNLGVVLVDTNTPDMPSIAPDLTDVSDTGSANDDNITSSSTPVIEVECSEIGATITLYTDNPTVGTVAGTHICVGVATELVNTSIQPEGTHNFTYTQTDLAGNQSAASESLAITIDLTEPGVPTVTPITGSDTTPEITGLLPVPSDPTDTVDITIDGNTFVATNNGDGTWTLPDDAIIPALMEGVYDIVVAVTDIAGNTSTAIVTDAVTIDLTAPTTPITAPDLQPASDTGFSSADDITTVATPNLDVVCTEIGNTITLYVDGVVSTTYICTSVGTQAVVVTPALADGTYSITYTDTDISDNESAQSPALSVTIDNSAPTAPTITAPTNGAPVTGSGEPGATVTITTPSGTTCSTVVDVSGAYSCTLSPIPVDGEDISASQVDLSGNVSPTTTNAGEIDTLAPTPPTINPITEGSVQITGTAEPNSIIDIAPITCTNAPVIADASGNWVCTDPAPALVDGDVVSVIATDVAGNQSGPSTMTVTVAGDIAVPVVDPIIAGASAVTGTGTPGAVIDITGLTCGNTPVVVDAFGDWNCSIVAPAPGEGDVIGTTQTVNRVTSDPTTTTVAPASSVAAPTVNPTNGQGVTGTGAVGSTVTVTDDAGNILCSTVVDGAGNWACDLIPDAEGVINVVQADTNGNQSAPTQVIVDTLAPTPPTINPITEGSAQITGTAEPNSIIDIVPITCTNAPVIADASGNWVCTDPAPALSVGDIITVVATDLAGNMSGPATTTVGDNTGNQSVAPTVNPITVGDAQITGTAVAGAIVDIAGITCANAPVIADASGNWVCTSPSPTPIDGDVVSVTVTQPGKSTSPVATTTVSTTGEASPGAPTVSPTDGDPITGITVPGGIVQVVDPVTGQALCTTIADSLGNYNCSPVFPVPTDEQQLVVITTDPTTNGQSNPVTVTVDQSAPIAPIVNPVSTTDTTITGVAEAGSTITIAPLVCDNKPVITDVNGNWNCDISSSLPLAAGIVINVVATDSAGNASSLSGIIVVIPTPQSIVELNKLNKLSIKCYADGYAKIKWNDKAIGEDGFKIQRRADGGEWVKIKTIKDEDQESYKDKDPLQAGVKYEWRVRAYEGDNRGDWSKKVSCMISGEENNDNQYGQDSQDADFAQISTGEIAGSSTNSITKGKAQSSSSTTNNNQKNLSINDANLDDNVAQDKCNEGGSSIWMGIVGLITVIMLLTLFPKLIPIIIVLVITTGGWLLIDGCRSNWWLPLLSGVYGLIIIAGRYLFAEKVKKR